MGELARRRSAHDLWISRSHLWGAGLGAVLLAVCAFSAGVVLGGGERAHAAPADPLGLGSAPDDSLVELLARVEASADPTSGMASLTFPGVLSGGAPGEVALPAEKRTKGQASTVRPAPGADAPTADARPEGRYTVALLTTSERSRAAALREQLQARDLPAWVAAERVDGEGVWRVSLGGFPTEAAARTAADRFAGMAEDLPIVAGGQVEAMPEVRGR